MNVTRGHRNQHADECEHRDADREINQLREPIRHQWAVVPKLSKAVAPEAFDELGHKRE